MRRKTSEMTSVIPLTLSSADVCTRRGSGSWCRRTDTGRDGVVGGLVTGVVTKLSSVY